MSPERLPKRARSLMEDGSVERILSSVSIVEIGIKSTLGKLKITEGELQTAIEDLKLKVISFSSAHAFGLFHLPGRTDMFDKMLVATALTLNLPIISGDREFMHYKGVRTIWK